MRPKRYLTQLAVATTVAAGLALALQGVVLAAVNYSSGTTGNDISYPNCGGPFPTDSFGIVGVTGGRAFTQNSCLSQEFAWASGLNGGSNPGAALYMNLNAPVGSTAREGLTGPYNTSGTCSHKDKACIAYNYGYNAAEAAYTYATDLSPAVTSSSWWLDIETSNSWSSNTSLNQYTISGAVAFFATFSSTNPIAIGLYSTPYQWTQITGQRGSWHPTVSPYTSYPIWQAGASSESNANTICGNSTAGFAGYRPELVQYVASSVDYDYAC